MSRICVVQADNRDYVDFLESTKNINKLMCEKLGYTYNYIKIENSKYPNMKPHSTKVYIVNELLQKSDYDILIFLDSDAWIHNPSLLKSLITTFQNDSTKHGCFSRDPYVNFNTYINSGSFILKINDFTKQMYIDIIQNFETVDAEYKNKWPFDQYSISDYVYKNNSYFNIFIPHILNTPLGKILRHNWWKNQRMWNDFNTLLNSEIIVSNERFDLDNYRDNAQFPNTSETGYEYKD